MIRAVLSLAAAAVAAGPAAAEPATLQLNPGDKVVLVGNTLAERMSYFGHFETELHWRFPTHKLAVRNLGWSADELKLRPRSRAYADHGMTLTALKPNAVIGFFGFNESFAGPKGLKKFEADLRDFIKKTRDGGSRVALVTPTANENLPARKIMAADRNNKNIQLYADAMKRVAAGLKVPCADVFAPTEKLLAAAQTAFTINGAHLDDAGYRALAGPLCDGLFGPVKAAAVKLNRDALHRAVRDKQIQHWFDYRAVNGYYIYGGRKKPFGVVNFPAEFQKLRKMVTVRDERIWAAAQGKPVADTPDDSGTGDFVTVKTNFRRPVRLTPPAESAKKFQVPDGFAVDLFASEKDFPDLQNPCQFAFDARGRLWVTTMPSYPMYLPGRLPDDKILILEDTDGDGEADKQTVFADKLHVPTGIELGDGGCYVAQQPNLLFLKDTDGDGRADVRKLVLHGFDSADSHHSISAFEWGPGGGLYFQEGTFHHTQVETPYGPERLKNAGIFRYEPRTEKFSVFVSYPFANPWGHVFDHWGQNFVADASGGANYFGTAFSGASVYPFKKKRMKQFLKKEWRPTSGCEFVKSRNFPDEMQGDYLINNCIGYLGVLNYKVEEDGSGFKATPRQPRLLRSTDPNFRPVDLQFGPDGALYICDWFNPLIGHMQHSLRDPKRDVSHGRIWRLRYTKKPLVTPPKIAGAAIPELLEVLRVYEDRARYQARKELRSRPTEKVMAAVKGWLAGIKADDPQAEHLHLEALWVCQHHDVVDVALLKRVLASKDAKAKAAATRVLGYWRDRVPGVMGLFRKLVVDDHPRVRLEAVRALSYFEGDAAAKAQEIAVESLVQPQDYYLKYTLDATLKTLDRK